MNTKRHTANVPVDDVVQENVLLRREVRVARQASQITAKLVVEQFVKLEEMLQRLEKKNLTEEKLRQELEVKNRELAEAARVATDATKAKSQFLACMSHEIRTPLHAIIGITDLLLAGPLSPEQHDYLATVKAAGDSLLAVISDVLDLSKIESDSLSLQHAVFDLHEAVGDTVKSLGLRAHQKGLELACHIRPEVPRGVKGDQGRLRQVIFNLVGNAIKFTESGEVVLEVRRETFSDGEVALHFTIRDTGIGIPPEKLDTVFQMFEQVDNTMTRRFEGAGLGLAISARLVGMMGGRTWVESEVNRGSTFHFTVRFGRVAEETAEVRRFDPAVIRDTRVLVVDDNAAHRLILQQMLNNWTKAPAVAPEVMDALRLLREAHRSGQPYDLVITDANMPDRDGFTLAQQIKDDAELGSTVVMMLSSGARAGDVARCERLGVAAYLLKPIKQSELFDAILMALGITGLEQEGAPKPDAEPGRQMRPLRILLVEDSPVNQKLAVGLLHRYGHTVAVANHGKEALNVLESQEFDLVLMDVQMPEMDGLEATRAIRDKEQQAGSHLPIIAMTAHVLRGDRERCLEAGMDEYLAKPIHATTLLRTMEIVLSENVPLKTPEERTLPNGDGLDWAEALQAVNGDSALLEDVLEAALDEFPKLLTAIHDAVGKGDAAALKLAAHTLKGTVRYFGENPVYDHAYRLEQMGRDHQMDGAEQALADLNEAVRQLTPLLQKHLHVEKD